MKDFLNKLNSKVSNMLEDENSLLSKTKKSLADKYIKIPITEEMFLYVFNKQNVEGIEDLTIEFAESTFQIKGSVKKMLIPIQFYIELKPKNANGRSLSFDIVELKPLNQDWIKKKLFNKPPVISYQDGVTTIDLNTFEKVKSIPVGTIKDFEIKNKRLYVSLGV